MIVLAELQGKQIEHSGLKVSFGRCGAERLSEVQPDGFLL